MGRDRSGAALETPGEHRFKWPPVSDGAIRLSAAQLAMLLERLDWSHFAAAATVRLVEERAEKERVIEQNDRLRQRSEQRVTGPVVLP
jgi:hypothetical protein